MYTFLDNIIERAGNEVIKCFYCGLTAIYLTNKVNRTHSY